MLKTRIVTALVLVAGLLSLLFLASNSWVRLAFAIVSALAGWEWAGLMKQGGLNRALYGAVVLAVCLWADTNPSIFPVLWAVAALFWLLMAPVWLARRWTLEAKWMGFALGLVVIVPTWAALVTLHGYGPWSLLGVLAMIWMADIAAYFTGRKFGKRKLAPAISPGKTREGAYGAIVGVLLYGLIAWPHLGLWNFADASAWLVLAAGLVALTVLSIMGDLFESLLKRQAGIKDSSQILPGHGGILDRIDSLTSTLPIVALALLAR